MLHQSLSSGRSDTRDIVQQGMYLAFASQRTVVLYGESVGFILDPCDQLKSFAVLVDGDLCIIIVEASGPVPVIFDHTAHRDI